MEHNAIIKAFADQALDMRHMIRREIGAHFDHDIALARLKGERVGIFGFCIIF
jgi:hypothetical protein